MNNVNKLLDALGENILLKRDKWTTEHQFVSGMRKWIANIVPAELLTRSVKDAVNSLMTLNQDGNFYNKFPESISISDYTGVGALPTYEQMQYIIHEIRSRTQKTHLSFVGEKSFGDFARYENLGLSTGTGFIDPNDFHKVRDVAIDYKYSKNYSPGIEVSNDNDTGGRSYEERLQRINNSIFAYEYPSDKLASFMQMEDIFPLRYDTNTHHLMMSNPIYAIDSTPESHWYNLFAHDDGREYNKKVGELFVHALNL